MKLGRVIGTVVATIRAKGTEGLKLLVVRPLHADLREAGSPFVATDASAQAGPGDLVTWEASREAALLHDPWFVPVDHAIVGIVDQHVHEEPVAGRHEHAASVGEAHGPSARGSGASKPGTAEGGTAR
jgi:ethanolamine utilization protein EutN